VEWTVAGEAVDRRLTGFGVHAGVAHLLGPGHEPIVELLEAGDALGFRLEQESLPNVPSQSFLFSAPLRPVRPTVNKTDAEHSAAAFEVGVGKRCSVVDVQPYKTLPRMPIQRRPGRRSKSLIPSHGCTG